MFFTNLFKQKSTLNKIEEKIEKLNEFLSYNKQNKPIIDNKPEYLENLLYIMKKFEISLNRVKQLQTQPSLTNQSNPYQSNEDSAIINYYTHSLIFPNLYEHFKSNSDFLFNHFMRLSIFTIKLHFFNNLFIISNIYIFQDLLFYILPLTSDSDPNVLLSELLYEITKLFAKDEGVFIKYETKGEDVSLNEISNFGTLVFSCLLNLIKNDHLSKDNEIKSNTRKAFLSCIQYPEILNSDYFKNCFFVEIIIDRLCTYFELLPYSFDIKENTVTMDIAYNLKETFNICLPEFLEFRDFLNFFNRLYDTIRLNSITEQIKTQFFNWFLIEYLQERLLSMNLSIFRTTLQYLVFLIKNIKNLSLLSLIFFFIFGFPDTNTDYNNKKTGREGFLRMKEMNGRVKLKQNSSKSLSLSFDSKAQTIQSIVFNRFNNKDTIKDEDLSNIYDIKCRDSLLSMHRDNSKRNENENPYVFDYKNHDYIGISTAIISKFSIKERNIDITCLVFLDVIIDFFPFLSVQRILLPFCESIVDKHKIQVTKLKNIIPSNVKEYIDFIENIEGTSISNTNLYEYINYNVSKSSELYIKNEIDFYLYYQSIRDDKEQLNFIDRHLRNSLSMSVSVSETETKNKNLRETYIKNEVLTNYLISHNKAEFRNKLTSNNYYISKLYDDETEAIEDEMKNIFITYIRHIIEDFTSFFYNSPIKNLFLTSILTKILLIPKLAFDPSTTLIMNLLLDEENVSYISIVSILKIHCREAFKIIKEEPVILSYVREINENDMINYRKRLKKEGFSLKIINFSENIFILKEFIKEFMAVLSHKAMFEHRIEQLFKEYSQKLDDYNFKDNLSVIGIK